MPHSLKVRLKNLNRDGVLSDNDIEKIFHALDTQVKLERLCEMYKQEGHRPARTISMEELKEFIS